MRAALMGIALLLGACTQSADEAPPTADASVEAEVAAANSVQEALAQMPPADSARAAGVDFRGVGQEPGWIVDIYQRDRIRVLLDYGETLLDFPLPTPTYPAESATQYATQAEGRALTITIRRAPCEDVMSGEPYPSTVELVIDDRTLNGCGKSV
ncbi:hypothetical protein [Vitreimonas flagellata]|uniref:hypothetical protein n=1 Tax=Vitreimonas flagellata TaxID=2560861 RepID=UPI0010749FDA|nr:hypothetical protein [Vitreimonas flagellata]